jgi:hypothetical protein
MRYKNYPRSTNMAQLRIETATYPETGKVYAELYYPDDEVIPLATTEPIFPNSEVAVKRANEMFENWMSLLNEELKES